jgi:hypothetical protein
VLIPVSLEEQLVSGTLEFAYHALVENRVDMSAFDNMGSVVLVIVSGSSS